MEAEVGVMGEGEGVLAVTVSVHPSQVLAGAACVRDLVGRVDLRTEDRFDRGRFDRGAHFGRFDRVAYFSFGSEGKRRSGRRKKDRSGKSPADAGVEDIIGKASAPAAAGRKGCRLCRERYSCVPSCRRL